MSVGLNAVLVVSAILFTAGAFAIIARRSALVMLIGTQLMFAAGGIAFVAFARFGLGAVHATAGPAVALFAGAIAVGELAVGVVVTLILYRESHNFFMDAERG
jgi:NADH:ubiquinone oxidoreductase subunit K